MVWLSTIGVAIYENGVAIYEWCGYLRMVWLSTKKVWLFQLAFLGLLVGAKKDKDVFFSAWEKLVKTHYNAPLNYSKELWDRD